MGTATMRRRLNSSLRSSSFGVEPRIREPPEENGLIALDWAPRIVQANNTGALKPTEAARFGISGNNYSCGGAEETHDGTYQAESNRNQRLWYIGTDPGRKCFNGSGFYCNSDQHTGTCDHDNGIPRNFCNGFFLWSQF